MRLTRVGNIVVALGVAAAGLWSQTTTAAPPPKGLVLTPIGVYRSLHFDEGGAEIAAYDAATKRVFIVSLADRRVDVLDIANPTIPFLADVIDITPWGVRRTALPCTTASSPWPSRQS